MKDLKDKMRRFNIHLTQVPKGEERKHKTNVSKKVTAGNFPELIKKNPKKQKNPTVSWSPVKPQPEKNFKNKIILKYIAVNRRKSRQKYNKVLKIAVGSGNRGAEIKWNRITLKGL